MLVQDDKDRALWRDPGWNGKAPATFAVVIGISHYDYLDGKKDSYGLGQLAVSALTAFRFFTWLKDEYRHPDKPLARCWLLLAATPAERAAAPGLGAIQTPPPTMERCREAIEAWYGAMKDTDSVYAQDSRAIFFFSGHGLEVTNDRQILLPSDYLRKPVRNVNYALSTSNLSSGLRGLPIPEHYFFLDACRNDHQELRETTLVGTPVLNEWPSYKVNADIKAAPIVYATGPGAAAWQPTDPAEGPSVFGKALIEGLQCRPNMVAVAEGGRSWVTVRGLEDFLDPKVVDLLRASGTRVKQPVRFWGPFGKIQFCEVLPPAPPAPAAPGPVADSERFEADDYGYVGGGGGGAGGGAPGAAEGSGGGGGGRGGRPVRPRGGPSAGRPRIAPPPSPAAAVEEPLETLPLPAVWPPPAANAGDFLNVIQNEFLSSLLAHAKVYDLAAAQWHPFEDQDTLKVKKIARSAQRHHYRIDVRIKPGRTIWLELNDPMVDVRAACVLRGDQYTDVDYSIEVDLAEREGLGVISDLDVVLCPENSGLLGEAADLWNRYRAVDIKAAAESKELRLLEKALRDKMQSPLAATVAALLLLRAWRHDLLHDWPKNLATWFPSLPDPCVVWSEHMLRTDHSDRPQDVIPWILQLEERGVPHTAEGLSIAERQASELLTFAFKAPKLSARQKDDHGRLEWLQERLRNALAVFRPGGLAVTFIGSRKRVVPTLMKVGTRPKKAGRPQAQRERPALGG